MKKKHLEKRLAADNLGEITIKNTARFKSESYNLFTEEINKIVWSSNDDKRMQSIDLIEGYAYEVSKDLVNKQEEIKCNNIIKKFENDNI